MRRRNRGCLIVGLVALAILVGVAAGWLWYTTTPQYVVRMTARAVDLGDWQSFTTYVNVPAVVGSAVDAEIARRFPDPDSLLRRVAESAKPQLTQAATAELRDAIEKRAGRSRQLPAMAYALGPADIGRLSSGEREARFRVVLPLRGERVPLTVRLARNGGRWHVVEVEQVDRLLAKLGVQSLPH